MSPQLQENFNNDIVEPLNSILNFPAVENDSVSLSDVDIWGNSDVESEEENLFVDWGVPLQNDLRDLLIKVTATDDLQTVTQLKLKVITREISLQQLSIYTPALRELVLDGSYVSSLRDLGCELKNLKVLRLNRCNLHYFDSVSGIEQLEEIYATDNHLNDISSCAFLPNVKVIDVRRNHISTTRSLFFLSLCTELQHLYLDGNDVTGIENFTVKVREMIPTLKFLDGKHLEGVRIQEEISPLIRTEDKLYGGALSKSSARNGSESEPRRFLIQFPPKLLVESTRQSNRTM